MPTTESASVVLRKKETWRSLFSNLDCGELNGFNLADAGLVVLDYRRPQCMDKVKCAG
jgi:hypothetical protein